MSGFRLFQSLPIESSAKSSAINDDGPNIYLAVPQTVINKVQIYKYSGYYFELYQDLLSENVDHVSSFQIGPRSYLAVGGQQASIYRYSRNGLKKEVTDIHLQDIKYFLPISVNNYRQDVLLLAQQDLNHSTHISNVIRIFLYENGIFNAHDEVPCRVFGVENHGVTCIVDDEWDHGIFGAAVVSIGQLLGVIVPTHKMHGAFFMFDTSLIEVEHPMVVKMQKIMEEKEKLEVNCLKKLLYEQNINKFHNFNNIFFIEHNICLVFACVFYNVWFRAEISTS